MILIYDTIMKNKAIEFALILKKTLYIYLFSCVISIFWVKVWVKRFIFKNIVDIQEVH